MDIVELVARLRAAGCVYAEDEAELLLEEAWDGVHLEELVRLRVAGMPLEQVVGFAEFRGLRLKLGPGVFVPRTRTGLVVDLGLRVLQPGAVVLDLCCGIGAIGAALVAAEPSIELHAVDIDPVAVEAARANLPGADVREGDLYDALPDELRHRVDLVVCNAPYVPTDDIAKMPSEAREYERRAALDGGEFGLDVHRRVAGGVLEWLAPGGYVVIETSRWQANRTQGIFHERGMDTVVRHDEEIDGTAVVAVRRDEAP